MLQCSMCHTARPTTIASVKGLVKKAKVKSPSESSLLFGVGSSIAQEQERIEKKLQQLNELGIKLSRGEMMTLLKRNCFSVHGAASEYFERLIRTDAIVQVDEEANQKLERTLKKLETVDTVDESFEVLGKTTMQALVNRQGAELLVGDELLLHAENAGKKRLKPGVSATSTLSGIVRIATLQHSQIGRLERNMEMLLHPLMKAGLVKLSGVCEVPPASSHMFASFDVSVFVYISLKAFDVFQEGNANFHLSDQLYSLLQFFNGINEPSLDALPSRTALPMDDPSSQVDPEELDTLFSECLGANELQKSVDGSYSDPSEDLVQYLNAIVLQDHQKQAFRWMLWRENLLKNGVSNQKRTDPIWEERHFRSKTTYFVNPYEKSASLFCPEPPAPCLGGILADDMGMGKTLMILSLIVYQKHIGEEKAMKKSGDSLGVGKPKKRGKTLVICPLSLLHQWKNETQDRYLPNTLSVYIYYGDHRDTGTRLNAKSLTKSDLVLTTYGVLSAEAGKNGVLISTEWNRVVLDEAHRIKNRASSCFKACSSLVATHRWCLTGTPIQNTLGDMFALLCFLQYQPWNRVAWWKRVITKPYEDGDDVNALGRLKALLLPILLRRTKQSRDKEGNMIAKLPPKHIDLVQLEFSTGERAFYQAIFNKSRAEFNGFVARGAARTNYIAIFALLLRLRQACDHPLLALGKQVEEARKPDNEKGSAATTFELSFQPHDNESSEAYYQRIAAQLQKDMQTSNRAQPMGEESTLNNDKSSVPGGLTSSYIESVLAQVEDGLDTQECPICLDPPQNAVLTPCAHVLCDSCLRESLVNDPDNGCPVCRTVIEMSKVFKLPPPSASKKQTEGIQISGSSHRAASDDDGTGFESAKLQQLLRDLRAIKVENDRKKAPELKRKVVVFSQWMPMLDMVSSLLARHGFSHCTFNGGLNQEARERVLTKFAKDPDVEVLVTSLKAGGVGLNLTCASVVILLDPWWNPGVEEQAIDRVHRLGQTQDVLVKRYVVKDTVEDMILQLQLRKEKLAKHVLVVAKTHNERHSERLHLDDLRSFFR